MSMNIIVFQYAMACLVGLSGIFLLKQNMLMYFIFFEVMLMSISMLFVLMSVMQEDMVGVVMCFFLLLLGAVESALSLSVLIAYYSMSGTLIMISLNSLKN